MHVHAGLVDTVNLADHEKQQCTLDNALSVELGKPRRKVG